MNFMLPVTKMAMLTLLAISTYQNSAHAQVFGCIARPGEHCIPNHPGRDDNYHPGRPDHGGGRQPGRPPGRPDYGQPPEPPPHIGRPDHGGYPGRPHRPGRPQPIIELRRSLNHAVYRSERWSLNQMFNLRDYRGYRLLEVEVIARPLRGREGYLELHANHRQESALRVTTHWPSSHRLWFNSYQVIGRHLRGLELGLTEVEVREVIVRVVRE